MARQAPARTAVAAFERDARRWLHAYPPRWRAERAEEALGLLADLAAPGADRLSGRERWGLLRGGLATRWRGRPPWWHWVAYRFFDRRMPRPWAPWAADDIAGTWYPVRNYLGTTWFLTLWFGLVPAFRDLRLIALLGVCALAAQAFWPEARRRRQRVKHLVPRHGEPVIPGAHVLWSAPRVRVEARSGWTTTAVVCALLLVAGGLSAATSPQVLYAVPGPEPVSFELLVAPVGPYRVVAVALVAAALLPGAVWAVLARRRLLRLLPQCPPQPHRVVRPVLAVERLSVAAGLAVGFSIVWLELTGRLVLGAGVLLGALGAVVLPVELTVLGVIRRAEVGGLAAVDVLRIVGSGRVPSVDPVARVLLPVDAAMGPTDRPATPASG